MRRKRKNFKGVLTIILALIVVLLCSIIYMGISDIKGKKNGEIVEIKIENGESLSSISNKLQKNNVIKFANVFEFYNIINNNYSNFQMGKHNIPKNAPYKEIYKIVSITPNDEGIKVLIPEGYEVYKIADALEIAGLVEKKEFLDVCENGDFDYDFIGKKGTENRLEGYLFPATYIFHKGYSCESIINTMLRKFDSVFTENYKQQAKAKNMSIKEVVTLASIIEREAGDEQDKKMVSSVFNNRISKGQKLESCATVQYILKERKPVLSIKDTQIKSDYNTYINEGLPPTPIANPGEESIKAALNPENTNYYFFVVDKNGKHIYSENYEQHEKAMKEVENDR